MRRTETPKPIWIKFCTVVDIPEVVTYTNFGDHRLRVFEWRWVKFPPLPLTFTCERVMTVKTIIIVIYLSLGTFRKLVRPFMNFRVLVAVRRCF